MKPIHPAFATLLDRQRRLLESLVHNAVRFVVIDELEGVVGNDLGHVPELLNRRLSAILQELGVGVGDALEFDVQGVPVAVLVGSIRTVDWQQVRPNFFFAVPRIWEKIKAGKQSPVHSAHFK